MNGNITETDAYISATTACTYTLSSTTVHSRFDQQLFLPQNPHSILEGLGWLPALACP